ncbi:structural maintenance of chromosomes protein 5-like [Humulus lupulus]|uniref:structural maintenance of chromosomes protein 5-like n=1 Tax=Humulus lupulus TaxID=3486 RepID=UPI002B402780|nr:structural maintenance of chromosomes protein 5-like [Humulus lupulus]
MNSLLDQRYKVGISHLKMYIGSKETDLKVDEVSKHGIFYCWTPENHYWWSRSRYGGHVSATVDTVVPSRLFLCNVKEIERLNAKIMELEEDLTSLEGSVRSLQSEQRRIDDEDARLEKEQEEIINIAQHELRKRREMQNHIDQKKQKLKSLEKEDDLDTRMAGRCFEGRCFFLVLVVLVFTWGPIIM